MSKIVFFSIPAHGHTNPTIPVVRELVRRGHQVWYYSFEEFRKKIKDTGATFIACDAYLPEISMKEKERKVGKDFAALIEMITDTTIAMDEKVCQELKDIKPNCIVSDSMCFWGKLFAQKLHIPYICSTTTFAFNQHTAKLMKPGFIEMLRMMFGMRRIRKKMKLLKNHGYPVENFISIVQNDNDTDTIVYTSKEFQPMANTFSDRYVFVGPSVESSKVQPMNSANSKLIYISLGTILNKNKDFYDHCIEAFKDKAYRVIMSVGEGTDISALGSIPRNFTIKEHVDQVTVLQSTDVFITHCGMNSVNEALYFAVPMVLYPQHSEQRAVANRVAEMKAGVMLKGKKSTHLAAAVEKVLGHVSYQHNAKEIAKSFQQAGGTNEAVSKILSKV